jgi:adenylate cyclase
MLNRVYAEQRTFRAIPSACVAESLKEVSALVASPILIEGHVWGAIYGDRRTGYGRDAGISESAAMLVETLACGVATGLARLEQEKQAMNQRVRFEQFFTSALARKLESQPDMLRAREAEVTVLFCDIRGFSTITERLGPAESIAWINDTLEELSKCVLAQGGVLVDYVGDELMAMWGAPDPQPDHAKRACLAAIEMFNRLPELNQRWESRLGVPMGFSVGINSGMARVGNVGSQCKFKYGALGNTVNVASRVQGAAKFVKSDVVVTRSTALALDERFCTRRLCLVRLVNLAEPVELHELETHPGPNWPELKQQYESALDAFHKGDFHLAGRTLGNLLEQSREDGPTAVLLRRAVVAITEPAESFDAVWKLSGKKQRPRETDPFCVPRMLNVHIRTSPLSMTRKRQVNGWRDRGVGFRQDYAVQSQQRAQRPSLERAAARLMRRFGVRDF